MVTEYTKEFKETLLKKIFSNPKQSVISLAKDANVPASTVGTWVRNYKNMNGKLMGTKRQRKQWGAKKKFEAVLESASMNEAEKSEYCRNHGIFPSQLKEWKKDCIAGCRKAPDKKYIKEAKKKEQQYKKRTKELERDLKRKDKALAETAALLVLKKKVQEIWGESEEE